MDRKNINRGFKKLRVWQDAVSLYVLACKIFANFPFVSVLPAATCHRCLGQSSAQYPFFAAMLNKLWSLTWYAYIGALLVDPRFSIQYIARYTKRAIMGNC